MIDEKIICDICGCDCSDDCIYYTRFDEEENMVEAYNSYELCASCDIWLRDKLNDKHE